MPYYAPQNDDDNEDFESKFNVIADSKNGNWDNMPDINDLHGPSVSTSNASGSK
jgi:hypothetical protein